jgi:hypothetical protein
MIFKLIKQKFDDYFFGMSVSYYNYQKTAFIFGFYLPKDVPADVLLRDEKYFKRIPKAALDQTKD